MQASMGEVEVPRRRTGDGTSASRRRHFFFCLASLWGYVLGVAVLAAALSRGAGRVPLDAGTAGWVTGGTLFVLVGGWVTAGAYREARRRSR